MNYISKFLSAVAVFLSAGFAATAQDFEVSPVTLEFNAAPGAMQTREVVITNHSNIGSVFRLRVEDYDIDEEGRRHTRQRGMVMHSCSNWISVSPSTLDINPNSQGVARVTMSVPADGNDSRWAQIVVSEAHERSSFGADNGTQAGVVLSPEIVIDVTQTAQGVREAKAKLSDFEEVVDVDGKSDSRVFAVSVENQGKTFLKGNLYIVAANMSTLQEYDILKRPITIFTGASQKFRLVLEPGMLPAGVYDFTCLLDMGAAFPIKGIRLKESVAIGQ